MTSEKQNKMGTKVDESPPMDGGGMGQESFNEQAKRGLEQYSHTFGKYISNKEEKEYSDQEKQKRDRAKKANKIYKRVCEDVGLKACFFSNFGDWTEYIDGRMSDADFQTNAVVRARLMIAEN